MAPKIHPAPVPMQPLPPAAQAYAVPAQAPRRGVYEGHEYRISTPNPDPQKTRPNYYFKLPGEDLNPHEVVYQASVQSSSIGWTQRNFFNELGDKRFAVWNMLEKVTLGDQHEKLVEMTSERLLQVVSNDPRYRQAALDGLCRRAEQEYLLANMVKGAMWAASEIAGETKVSIAVRGTGLPAHMGIEMGAPTKAQEFKNKTSKLEDVVLCEYVQFEDVGAVVHYDPRPTWMPQTAKDFTKLHLQATENDWFLYRQTYLERLEKLRERLTRVNPVVQMHPLLQVKPVAPGNPLAQTHPIQPMNPLVQVHPLVEAPHPAQAPPQLPTLGMYQLPTEASLKSTFLSRSKEYFEEDHAYRLGKFAIHTHLEGPYVRLKQRPKDNMVGDHDLFAYMDEDAATIIANPYDQKVCAAQKALQESSEFQAQHGGIWYWKPGTNFNQGIKDKIMGAHGPEGKEPLVLIQKGQIRAAYFCGKDIIKPVWNIPGATSWMETTYTGKLLKPLIQG